MQNTTLCRLTVSGDSEVFHKVTFSNERGYVAEIVSSPNSSVCSSWILFSAVNLWPVFMQGCILISGLLFCFIGVAILSDVFMESIEVITSKRRRVTVFDSEKGCTEVQEVLLWNDTVANLTLMALGSSAPEILLAVIESVQRLGETQEEAEHTDGLGTFTIVGSAAFNLLVITAVCIISVEPPDVKKITDFGVFLVTTAWSVFAYVWLLIVLELSTPGVVEMWEAFLTLAFFPMFVLHAWAQDIGCWKHKCQRKTFPLQSVLETQSVRKTRLEIVGLDARPSMAFPVDSVRQPTTFGQDRDRDHSHYQVDEELHTSKAQSIDSDENIPRHRSKLRHSLARARLRHVALRSLLGTSRPPRVSAGNRFALTVETVTSANRVRHLQEAVKSVLTKSSKSEGFRFSDQTYFVLKNAKGVRLDVLYGPNSDILRSKSSMRGSTPGNGTSKWTSTAVTHPHTFPPVEDYNGFSSRRPASVKKLSPAVSVLSATTVLTELDEMLLPLTVEYETRASSAKQGVAYAKQEGTLTFKDGEDRQSIYISLDASNEFNNDDDFYVVLKNPSIPGTLSNPKVVRVEFTEYYQRGRFEFDCFRYRSDGRSGTVTATVVRTSGSDGTATVQCRTIDGTAIGGSCLEAGIHYESINEGVVFGEGETSKQILVKVNRKENLENKNFMLVMTTVTKDAQIGERSAAMAILTPSPDDNNDAVIGDIADHERMGLKQAWLGQFQTACTIGGETDKDRNAEKPSILECVLFLVTFPWNFACATIPPRSFLGGWPTFCFSLAYIGVCTVIIEQLATMFGCVIGLRNSVSGITFVALGTSLPDLFASRSAARHERHADAAIGNITGSNSVNVFLGMGLSWVISACYNDVMSQKFYVSRFNLPFSVIVFSGCAIICVTLLILRRKLLSGELGGQRWMSLLSAGLLLFLWFLYILLSSLRAYDLIPGI